MEKAKRKSGTYLAMLTALAALSMIETASAQTIYSRDLSPEIAGSTVYAGPAASYCHCKRAQRVSRTSGFGFGPGMGYSVENKAPHNGFDLNGDGVHPPIGPITD